MNEKRTVFPGWKFSIVNRARNSRAGFSLTVDLLIPLGNVLAGFVLT